MDHRPGAKKKNDMKRIVSRERIDRIMKEDKLNRYQYPGEVRGIEGKKCQGTLCYPAKKGGDF